MAEPRPVEAGPGAAAGDPRRQMVERALKRVHHQPEALIEVLHVAQNAYGYLDRQILHDIARALHLPESEVFGVATFYHFFTLEPAGEHACIVCTGTVCHLQGAGEILAGLERTFHLSAGRTSDDGRLTLKTARCLGNCTLAPMLHLDGRVLGKETAESVVRQVRNVLARGGGEEGAGPKGE